MSAPDGNGAAYLNIQIDYEMLIQSVDQSIVLCTHTTSMYKSSPGEDHVNFSLRLRDIRTLREFVKFDLEFKSIRVELNKK